MDVAEPQRVVGTPTERELCTLLAPGPRRHPSVVELHRLLETIDPAAPHPARLDQLEALARWVCGGPPPPDEVRQPGLSKKTSRLDLLLAALGHFEPYRARLAELIRASLAGLSGLKLFAEVGLPNDRGFLQETADRLARRFLPTPPDHADLAELCARMFRHKKDADWLATLPIDRTRRLSELLAQPWVPLRASIEDSISLIATRISALGLSEDIRRRSPAGQVRESPFFRLPHARGLLLPVVAECRAHVRHVQRELERYGVSVDVVYCLDVIERGLDRIEVLLPLTGEDGEHTAAATALLAELTAARLGDRSLSALLAGNTRLLARKVIERAGNSGEHYITSNRSDWWTLVRSAGGGGLVTAVTVVLKFLIVWAPLSLFLHGFLASTLYVLSFVGMQLLGFTLATKQPSMTAATLAGSIREQQGGARLDDLTALIARICRSQVAAALGNIVLVTIGCIVFHILFRLLFGHPFVDPRATAGILRSFSPIFSGTILFAALTGVLLWLSSLVAGWVENWTAYRRIPEAIEHHRGLARMLGKDRCKWIADFITHHIGALGGNLSLGILLGMTPAVGGFFGVPLQAFHVTLSTGSLTLAACANPAALSSAAFVSACLGIVLIGVLNFGVSFALALTVAFRAREVTTGERIDLFGAVVRRFVRSPGQFFFPPKHERSSTAAGH